MINLTKGTFTLLKPTIYPGPNDLVQHSLSRLELVHSNSEGSGELPSHHLLLEIFKTKHVRPFVKMMSPNCSTVSIL
jgi:hypothetical protein